MVQSLLEMINSSEEDKQQQIEVEKETQPDPIFFLSNDGNQKIVWNTLIGRSKKVILKEE